MFNPKTEELDASALLKTRHDHFASTLTRAFDLFVRNGGDTEAPIEIIVVLSDGCGSLGCSSISDFRPDRHTRPKG